MAMIRNLGISMIPEVSSSRSGSSLSSGIGIDSTSARSIAARTVCRLPSPVRVFVFRLCMMSVLDSSPPHRAKTMSTRYSRPSSVSFPASSIIRKMLVAGCIYCSSSIT